MAVWSLARAYLGLGLKMPALDLVCIRWPLGTVGAAAVSGMMACREQCGDDVAEFGTLADALDDVEGCCAGGGEGARWGGGSWTLNQNWRI